MGCTNSTPVEADAGSPSAVVNSKTAAFAETRKKKTSSEINNIQQPRTRARTDSWALPNSPPSPKSSPAGKVNHSSHSNTTLQSKTKDSSIEKQWKAIWDTHAQLLVDPQDVPAVLDSLMNAVINQLSPVEVTLLQRRIRSIIRILPNPANQSKMGRVFSSSPNLVEVEAKNAATTQHLLTQHVVLNKLLRQNVVIGPTNVQHNAFTLMLYLSDSLWPRVTHMAHHTAQAAQLELDVNKQKAGATWKMPKPSMVPDLSESPELPPGVTPQALMCILAMGRRPTVRDQRLQLFFYLCLDSTFLADFLARHPAGGTPCWLLEVGQKQVVSLASLTHYHYYGHAFLPVQGASPATFSRSKSKTPLYVSAATVFRVVSALLAGHTVPTVASIAAIEPRKTKKPVSSTALAVDGSTHSTGAASESTSNGTTATNGTAVPAPPLEPDTHLMRALQAEGEAVGRRCDYLDNSIDDLAAVLLRKAQLTTDEWTLNDFKVWADEVLTDTVLDACFHELFGKGIFPGPSLEKRLVQHEWMEWQRWTEEELVQVESDAGKNSDIIAKSVKALMELSNGQKSSHKPFSPTVMPWGRVGGLDGGGGLGRGVLYCIDRKWWDTWAAYVGWTWMGQKPKKRKSFQRPGYLSNEALLENDSEILTRGTLGSFEMMKTDLKKNRDYVLVPPGVWNVLFELYSGGPPLPRMVLPPDRKSSDMSTRTERSLTAGDDELDDVMESLGKDIRVSQLPDHISVATNPWIVHCSLCDPQQPYRRGDVGHVNIRVQVMPYQPFWRLVVEIFSRFPLSSLNAFDEGVCKGRLWKRIEQTTAKESMPRFGPWTLLCKNRSTHFPLLTENGLDWKSKVKDFLKDWQDYAEGATVEDIGLQDGAVLMLEVAVLNKAGDLIWPREAAAQAGRAKRLADEEKHFRNTLQGLDKDGNVLLKPPKLVGMNVDAMDGTGRWHHATIVEVEIVDEDTEVEDEDGEEGEGKTSEPISRKKVKVKFKEHEGHFAWIDVESDRLAKAGKFTTDTDDQSTSPSSKGAPSSPKDSEKGKVGAALVKKASGVSDTNGSADGNQINHFPGLGACGLTNLGNTCYQNSAIQCMGYMPLLRSYLLSAQYKQTGDLNKDNPLGTGGKLLEEISELLRVIWSATQGEKTPTRFRTQLGRMNSQFAGADQQDAQEFLNYVLDVLHEDSNRVRKKPYVEALEDDWVERMSLQRVGEESWRRFLRRNQSIMASVAMGQVLNTVTCPVCNYSSRNFDPFNLLSVTIPTVADVIFQVTVYRRGTFANTPHILNRPTRKDDRRGRRFVRKNVKSPTGPPADSYVAEQYVIAMSRLADSSELRLQVQNVCGIPGTRFKLYRAEEVLDEDADPDSIFYKQIEMTPLTEKEGPCSQLARKKQPDEEIAAPTLLIAFENTLKPRPTKKGKDDETVEDTADEDEDEADQPGPRPFPSPEEEKKIKSTLEVYGDSKECRFYDTDPQIIAQAVSRSVWPKSDDELKLRKGLRVDAKDNRGSWYPGNVVELAEVEVAMRNTETGEERKVKQMKAVVHFDNFSPKWDEEYTLADFEEGKVQPLYTYAKPKPRPIEFLVHHRHFDTDSEKFLQFGQSFYIQCHNEWSTARAAAHILAQASRFVRRASQPVDMDEPTALNIESINDQLERFHSGVSNLIDLLVECDKEFISMALGVETNGEETSISFRNHKFDPSKLMKYFDKNVKLLFERLPFEINVATHDISPGNTKTWKLLDEKPFPVSLIRTMSNVMHIRQTVVLRWRLSSTDTSTPPFSLYSHPTIHHHKPGLEVLKMATKVNKEKARRTGKSSGIDLGVCLTEFCKMQKLTMDDNWRCPKCKEFREGQQSMNLWRLPDFLTFHIKRFNMSARWREKLTTKINFPLTGLDVSEWCHKESHAIQVDGDDSHVYDLIGVVNHYGSMTGGHYVACCKASACTKDGREEAAYGFNGFGADFLESEGNGAATGWRLGRPKVETNFQKEAAQVAARSATESAEPLWLQFDDELVEPMPPRNVVSETAYVLFYRRRRITSSNIARYSTLE